MSLFVCPRYQDPDIIFRASPDPEEGDENTTASQGGNGGG